MNNLNTVLIEGNLTRDPKEAEYAADYDLCKFPIANNRYYLKKNGEWQTETAYFIIEVYGQAAKACLKYLHKGRGVRVVGRLKFRKWTDNGTYRETVTIIAEHIEFQPERQKASRNPIADADAGVPAQQTFQTQQTTEPLKEDAGIMQKPDAVEDEVEAQDLECMAEIIETSSDDGNRIEEQEEADTEIPVVDDDCEGGEQGF